MNKPILQIENVGKTFTTDNFQNHLSVLKNINLSIEENEFVCILGPSGCGKSTLLRIASGLETATSGQIFYKGEPHSKPRREIGMVFQNYSLMPWLNVYDNIGLGLDFKKVSKKERARIIDEHLEMIGMTKFAKSYPYELSGGMQQRVAIARALANNPDIVLMDEPFGALDAYTRIVLQKELLKIYQHHKKTIIFVTHSVDEAIYLADRIILMSRKEGKIEKEVKIEMSRPRDRSDAQYAKLTKELLDDLERANVIE